MNAAEGAAAVALGLVLAIGAHACEDTLVPSPVAAPESAASSGCAPVTWRCCRVESEEPTCVAGEPACEQGFYTCEPDASP